MKKAKKEIFKGWVIVGSYGKIIALTFDDKDEVLVNKDFTTAEAKRLREKVFRAELTFPLQ